MIDMMQRRRGMIKLQEQSSDWDYEWDYTQGLLSSNGFTKTISGTEAAEALQEDGVLISSAFGSYIRFDAVQPTMSVGVGEYLVVLNESNATGAQNLRLCLSNGTNGVQVYVNSSRWRIMNRDNPSAGTIIANAVNGETYRVRLELGETASDVYINGTKVAENVPNSSTIYCPANRLFQQNGGSTLVQSVKYKFGRR